MTHITRAALALVLTCGLAVQLSAQSASREPDTPGGLSHVAARQVLAVQAERNPPDPVRHLGPKTRLIVAIVSVASLVTLGVMFHGGR